jgi:hypothetical protein
MERKCVSPLLLSNTIPKYFILVIELNHDSEVVQCGSISIALLQPCLIQYYEQKVSFYL